MFAYKVKNKRSCKAAEVLSIYSQEVREAIGPKGNPGSFKGGGQEADSGDNSIEAQLIKLIEGERNGVKTALIFADAVCNRHDTIVNGEELVQIFAEAGCWLEKMNAQSTKGLPGGGMWMMNLVRPLNAFCRSREISPPLWQAVVGSLKYPLLALIETAGYDVYDTYAQIKNSMPNQFYSLHHHGLAGSIPDVSRYADVGVYGFDLEKGKIADLMEANITISLEECKRILKLAEKICLWVYGQ